MTTTLDRMFLVSFFRSYFIVWTSLISLYVVIDLFTNIDDFGSKGGGLGSVVTHIAQYYGYRVALIFDLLAEFITLMAAMFTVAWLQRNNELLPQLSAGIPTRRVIRPILLGAAITLALGPVNKEFVIPRIADELMKPRDDRGRSIVFLRRAWLSGTAPAGYRCVERVGRRRRQRLVLDAGRHGAPILGVHSAVSSPAQLVARGPRASIRPRRSRRVTGRGGAARWARRVRQVDLYARGPRRRPASLRGRRLRRNRSCSRAGCVQPLLLREGPPRGHAPASSSRPYRRRG